MKKKKLFKTLLASLTAITMAVSTPVFTFADADVVDVGTVDIEMKIVYDSWINYPDAKFGTAYNAGWSYNAEEEYMNTTQNVGWTGFYNPEITNFTEGKISFDMKNANFDPCGFTWGMKVGGTEEDPVYSFYAYEECEYSGNWSIAYISEWHPSMNGYSHRGPLYHGTIDATDGTYDHSGKNAAAIGYSDGTVLAYGELDKSLKSTWHTVELLIEEKNVTVSINGEELTKVDADVVSGSFGPCAVSNPDAYFSNLTVTTTDTVVLKPFFEYRDASGAKTNNLRVGSVVSVEDLSTFEGAEIVNRYWTVTKDGTEIYNDTKPFTEYTKEAGTYVTSLRVRNKYNITSSPYSDTLVVTEDPATLTPLFAYVSEGKDVTEIVQGTKVSIDNRSAYTLSPITSTLWKVTKDGTEVYSGATPYDAYDTAGTYDTTLTITNEEGTSSDYSAKLVVTAPVEQPTTEQPSVEETPAPSQPASETAAIAPTQKVTSAQSSPRTGDSHSSTAIMIEMVLAIVVSVSIAVTKQRKKSRR